MWENYGILENISYLRVNLEIQIFKKNYFSRM